MKSKELEAQNTHLHEVVRCLLADPMATEHDKEYINRELSGYLTELIEKDGNLAHGIVVALEQYLDK